ncbi:MAG: hypothetical protein ACU837_09785 [Gammaproteobacteria bacterium]
MNISVGVDIKYYHPIIVPSSFFKSLMESGWQINVDGISHDDFTSALLCDLKCVESRRRAYLWRWLKGLVGGKSFDDSSGELVFSAVHQETGMGGSMIISEDRQSLHWVIQANIPYFLQNTVFVDFSKCLSIIFPAINSVGQGYFEINAYAESTG